MNPLGRFRLMAESCAPAVGDSATVVIVDDPLPHAAPGETTLDVRSARLADHRAALILGVARAAARDAPERRRIHWNLTPIVFSLIRSPRSGDFKIPFSEAGGLMELARRRRV